MKNRKSYEIVIFITLCTVINFVGRLVSSACSLPLWLDCTGTIMAAYVMGPICGAIIGAASNLMYGALSHYAYAYALTNAVVGVIAGICERKKVFEKSFSTFSMGILLALNATVVSAPLNFIFSRGYTGNLWGDGVINYFTELLGWHEMCCVVGEFYVDLVDKLVSVFVLYFAIKIYRNITKRHLQKISATVLAGLLLWTFLGSTVTVRADEITDAKMTRGATTEFDSLYQTIYNRSNGIPAGEVNDIEQTMDGMLWIGTYSGLYQYDGSGFTFMGDFDSVRNANCLYTDEEGRLWIGTNDNGLSICTNNEIVNVIDQADGLPENSVRSIGMSPDGLFYVGTSGSMCVIELADGMKVSTVIDELSYVWDITTSKQGYVGAVTLSGQLALLSDSKILHERNRTQDGGEYSSACFDDEGYLYAATSEQTLEKYEIKDDRMQLVKIISYDTLVDINSITIMDGRIFLCADNGIGYIDGEEEFCLIHINEFDSSIQNMLVDYQGNYWFSSSRLGLLELSPSISEAIYPLAGLEQKVVNAVCYWNGNFYFGTDGGLDIADGALKESIEGALTEELKNIRIRCLLQDTKNHLWIATFGHGVYEVSPDHSYQNYTTVGGLISDKTRALIELADGSVAVATEKGISLIKNGKVWSAIGRKEGLSTAKTLCMFEQDNVLYAGTDGGGIAVIKDGRVFDTIRRADGLSSDIILRITEASDGSGVYVVTSNGLNFVTYDREISQLDQFPYYNNYDVIPCADGNLWVTGSAGIYLVNEQNLLNGRKLDYELLDSKKGICDSLTANSWNYLDEAGNLYLCTDSGVIRINVEQYDRQKISYRISLENMRIDDVPVTVEKEDVTFIDRDAVRIEFFPMVINFSASDPYVGVWLEGFDSEPKIVPQSELESVVYTNLPSGTYTFHLAIYDNKQEQMIEEITYQFEKEKAIYDNWWFKGYIIGILAILLTYLVWMIVGSHIAKSLKIQKKEFENLKLKHEAEAAVAAGEAKDKFLALMSHDLRTPINTIIGMNEMVLRDCSQQTVREYALDIKNAGNTLLSLVNTILDFSKIEEGKMEIIPVSYETSRLIHNIVCGIEERAIDKGLQFDVEVEDTIPCELYGDDVRIGQVITNLLTNAVKYTEKGSVRLTIRSLQMQGDVISLYVEVKDTGIGIREEDMERLFESFQRLDEKRNHQIEGTGLGISIVTNLLHMMGSELKVESRYGEGSTFSFVLEQKVLSKEPIGNIIKRDTGEMPKDTKKPALAFDARLLVVDDNRMNIKVACNLLRIFGIKPDVAFSGEEAIECVKAARYDLILLDHMMPGMDGIETLHYMRDNCLISDTTKVIILTANALNGARDYYLSAGFDDYLSKPIEVEVLESKLRKYLKPKQEKKESSADLGTSTDMSTAVTMENSPAEGQNNLPHQKEAENDMDRLHRICPQIDTDTGLKYCVGEVDFYLDVIREYERGNKADELESYYEQKDWHNYRVLVHSVKSNSMSIGAVELSTKAKDMEAAAKENDVTFIQKHHRELMEEYRNLLEELNEFLENQ